MEYEEGIMSKVILAFKDFWIVAKVDVIVVIRSDIFMARRVLPTSSDIIPFWSLGRSSVSTNTRIFFKVCAIHLQYMPGSFNGFASQQLFVLLYAFYSYVRRNSRQFKSHKPYKGLLAHLQVLHSKSWILVLMNLMLLYWQWNHFLCLSIFHI